MCLHEEPLMPITRLTPHQPLQPGTVLLLAFPLFTLELNLVQHYNLQHFTLERWASNGYAVCRDTEGERALWHIHPEALVITEE